MSKTAGTNLITNPAMCGKLMQLLIWGTGLLVIGFTDYISHRHYVLEHFWGFLFVALFSSAPFGALAIYYKGIWKSTVNLYYELSGFVMAYVSTLFLAIWAFNAPIDDALNPSGFFWILGFGAIYIGYGLGKAIYILVDRLWKK